LSFVRDPREALESCLIARRCGFDALGSTGYRELLASLDEAEKEIDACQGVRADSLAQKLAKWAGK
jgi:hypothetical protein